MSGRATLGRRYLSVAAPLREMLDSGRCQPGERLPAERQLSEELETPRGTIREAVIIPGVEGRVEVRQLSGVYTFPKTLSETAAPVAASVANSQIADMRRALALEEADISRGRGAYAGDAAFHRLVAEATQNEALVATSKGLTSIRSTSSHWARIHLRIFDQTCRGQWSDDHCGIVRGPERRVRERARAAMARHLGNVSDSLLQQSAPDISVPAKAVGRRCALRSVP